MFPAIIAAAASLVQGMMAQKAAKEQQQRQAMADNINSSFNAEKQGVQSQAQGQQGAFQSLMDTYKSAYMGR